MNCQILLSQITAISQKYDLLYQKTGGYFNIFEVANIAYDEVTICRVLHELLSPTGSHCQGAVYLKLFFESVLHIQISEAELETTRVFREYQIDAQRRIDLVIETATKFIPIEVKIYAGEQENQCYDYFVEARKRTEAPKIYYLTRFGTSPGEYSAKGLTENEEGYEEVVNLSFSDDILGWLDLCLKQSNTLKIAPIREVLLQLVAVIRKFTDKMGDEKEMEIKELLLASSDNIKSAIAIQSTLNEVREEIMLKLFRAIEEKVGIQKINNQYDFEYENNKKIKTYYNRKHSTYPGISFFYKDKNVIHSDKDVWVRIEIDYKIFIGYCCPVNGEATNKTLFDDEIRNALKVEPCTNNWWAYWEYVPNNDEVQSPDFKEHNQAYYDLFDHVKFDAFVDVCAEKIKNLLK